RTIAARSPLSKAGLSGELIQGICQDCRRDSSMSSAGRDRGSLPRDELVEPVDAALRLEPGEARMIHVGEGLELAEVLISRADGGAELLDGLTRGHVRCAWIER